MISNQVQPGRMPYEQNQSAEPLKAEETPAMAGQPAAVVVVVAGAPAAAEERRLPCC